MDKQARIQGKYRLTTQALSQLCSRLAPGYAQTVHDIAGSYRTEAQSTDGFDPQLAISITNRLIRLRFSRINGYCMIIDREKKQVDGIVGRKYAFFSNLDLYMTAKDFVKQSNPPAFFKDAAIYGRRMMVRFGYSKPLFVVPVKKTGTDDPFYGGYHFANSEIGDCSIKAGATIIRALCDNKAVSEFTDGSRLTHVRGKRFEEKLYNLLDQVQLKAEHAGQYKAGIAILITQNLGLGKDEESHARRLSEIVSQLHRHGLTKQMADAVVARALVNGSYKHEALLHGKDPMRVYATRTAYDMFNALTAEAKKRSIDVQEKAEQLAFKMLSGRFVLS